MSKEEFPITKERIAEIAIKFIKNSECLLKEYNSTNASCISFVLENFKKAHHGVIVLLDIEDYVENGESEEELADDLNISISELKDFELYLYNKYSEK
jgi:hypothetical protein